MSVGVGKTFESVCMFVCLFVWSITPKRMIPMFKLGVWNDLAIPCSSKVKVTGSVSSFHILEPCILLEPRFINIHYVALPVVCSFADV